MPFTPAPFTIVTAMGAPPVAASGEGYGYLVTENGATPCECAFLWQDNTWTYDEGFPSWKSHYIGDDEIIAWSNDRGEAARLYAAYAEAWESGDEDPVDVVRRMLAEAVAVIAPAAAEPLAGLFGPDSYSVGAPR